MESLQDVINDSAPGIAVDRLSDEIQDLRESLSMLIMLIMQRLQYTSFSKLLRLHIWDGEILFRKLILQI